MGGATGTYEEIFAAFIAHTDYEVGRLIKAAQDGPAGENTLILYIVGDNGDDYSFGITGTENDPGDEISDENWERFSRFPTDINPVG